MFGSMKHHNQSTFKVKKWTQRYMDIKTCHYFLFCNKLKSISEGWDSISDLFTQVPTKISNDNAYKSCFPLVSYLWHTESTTSDLCWLEFDVYWSQSLYLCHYSVSWWPKKCLICSMKTLHIVDTPMWLAISLCRLQWRGLYTCQQPNRRDFELSSK